MGYIFDPDVLKQCAARGIDLPLEEAFDAITFALAEHYPGHIYTGPRRWVYNNAGGAKGMLWCSQVAPGNENALRIRVYGEKGGIEWVQAEPNRMEVKWTDRPMEVKKPGNPYLSDIAQYNTRMPAGHPEGLIEAFANIYRNFAACLQARLAPGGALVFVCIVDANDLVGAAQHGDHQCGDPRTGHASGAGDALDVAPRAVGVLDDPSRARLRRDLGNAGRQRLDGIERLVERGQRRRPRRA